MSGRLSAALADLAREAGRDLGLPDDLCRCGDYRHQHDERGCRLCRNLPTPASPGCGRFDFSRASERA
jgi:hypothetical protein